MAFPCKIKLRITLLKCKLLYLYNFITDPFYYTLFHIHFAIQALWDKDSLQSFLQVFLCQAGWVFCPGDPQKAPWKKKWKIPRTIININNSLMTSLTPDSLLFYSAQIKHLFGIKELNESQTFLTAIFPSNLTLELAID